MIENLVLPQFFKAVLVVNVKPESKVTATLGDTTITGVSDGTVTFNIPTAGIWKIKATKDGKTAEESIEITRRKRYDLSLKYYKIYGIQWDGSASTKWSRTDSSINFVNPNPAINNGTGSSPFDDIMPWSGMVRVSDSQAGELVAIPKFWYKWTKIGKGLKLQIANDKPDEPGYHVSPAHMNREDGRGERNIVYIGRYHSSGGYNSVTGVMPRCNITRSTARTNIHKLGNNIWQYDWYMHMTVWMLYLVEFADWNSQTAIGYGRGDGSPEKVGKSDSMKYHTGTPYATRSTRGVGVQYRYIESLWDNAFDWVDGCYYNSSGMNIINNPSKFSDTTNGKSVGRITTNYPSEFNVIEVNGFQSIYPIRDNGSRTTYSCDYWSFSSSKAVLSLGGSYYHDSDYGINCVDYSKTSSTYYYISSRLMKLP